jgi:hypothetical protein
MSASIVPKLDSTRYDALVSLAKGRFADDLYDGEIQVLRYSSRGGFPEPANSTLSPVRSEFLRWIITDDQARTLVDPRGLRVWCSTIEHDLNLSDCSVAFPLDFRLCVFEGAFSLVAADTQQISFIGCELRSGITADRLVTHDAIFIRLSKSFHQVRLHAAQIMGTLDFSGSQLTGSKEAIILDQARIQGDLSLKSTQGPTCVQMFRSEGCIHLNGASIQGDLVCTESIIDIQSDDQQDCAFYLDRCKIGGSLTLSQGFVANRSIRGVGAQIGGDIELRSAHLQGIQAGPNFNRAQVEGSVFMDVGFEAAGDTNLANATIGNDLNFNGSRLGRVICEGTRVEGDLIWTNVQDSSSTRRLLNLSGTTIRALRDDEKSWPQADRLILDGFAYKGLDLYPSQDGTLVSSAVLPPPLLFKAEKRLEWLALQSSPDRQRAQPWVQLANYCRELGHDEEASHVLFVYDCGKADSTTLRMGAIRRWIARWFAGLREKPLRILRPVCLCLAIAFGLFWQANRMRAIAPTNIDAYRAWEQGSLSDQAYPLFSPLVYSIENTLPVVRLGQNDSWSPDPHYVPQNWFPAYPSLVWSAWFSSYRCLSGLRVVLNLLGWGFGVVLGLALASRLKR